MAKEKSDSIEVSLVAPVFNEEESVGPFYQRIVSVMERLGLSYEIVFINDGSSDGSFAKLKMLHSQDERVMIVDLSRNFGKEIALTAGIDFARGSCVIPIDVDLQDPPEVIPRLIDKWREGFDVVYASRLEREGETVLKKATASAFYRLIAGMTRFPIPKNTGDFRLMNRRVVDALKRLRETNRFMKGLFSWVGFNQTGIVYTRERRFAGKTKWNYNKLFNLAIEAITSFSEVPLKIASLLGLIISLFAIGYGFYLIVRTLFWGNPVPGYTSLMAVILFLGGIQLISIGIIGEYVGRIYNESKRRPLYLVRSLWGFKEYSEGCEPIR
jgi:glycosyltransferase involved in cell wall biosynthesis